MRARSPRARLELDRRRVLVAEPAQRAPIGEPRFAEVERKALLLEQLERLREALDRDVGAALGRAQARLDQEAGGARVEILLRHAPEREDRELARVAQPVLADQDVDEDPVDVDEERSADLERERKRVPQALLGELELRPRERAERERAQVLQLVEAVAGPLEPVERLEPEAARPRRSRRGGT